MNDKPSVVILRFLRGNAGVQNLRHAQPGTVDFFVVDGMAEEPIQIRQGREFFILPILFKDLRTRRLIQIHQRVQDHFEFIVVKIEVEWAISLVSAIVYSVSIMTIMLLLLVSKRTFIIYNDTTKK